MTIDEAIEKERNTAKIKRKEIELMQDYYSCNTIQRYEEYAEQHEQLLEWLEELKEIKSNGRYVQGNKAGQKIGYRNAIDDFAEKLKQKNKIFDISNRMIDEIAEQLKEGGKE